MLNLTDAVLSGLAPLLGNGPKKITVEYHTGQTITLTGLSLQTWWAEYSRMYILFRQMTTSDIPTYSSEQIQQQFDEVEDDEN